MVQPAELEPIELNPEQVAAVLAYAKVNNMSPQEVVRQAVDMLTGKESEPSHDVHQSTLLTPTVDALTGQVKPNNLPKGFVSRHPDRDYSWFGSLRGEFGDGGAYQKQVRSRW